jgi:hypothetical protein
VPALQLERLVDGSKHSVGRVCGPRDIGVGQDGKELWRCPPQHPWCVDITDRACQSGCHCLQGLLRSNRSIGLDQKDAKISLITVSPRKLVLENRPHETIVEEARGPIDYVKRLGLGVIDLYATPRTEHRPVRQGRPASQACLSFRPAA